MTWTSRHAGRYSSRSGDETRCSQAGCRTPSVDLPCAKCDQLFCTRHWDTNPLPGDRCLRCRGGAEPAGSG